MTKSKRIAIYARVSTDSQSTDNQVRELRQVAERHGWSVVAEFVDQGISGAKGRDKRPQFDALLRGVARREFDLVAAWSVDRLGRSLQDWWGSSAISRRSGSISTSNSRHSIPRRPQAGCYSRCLEYSRNSSGLSYRLA